MNVQEMKQKLDELVSLRQENTKLAQQMVSLSQILQRFSTDKDNMLVTLVILLDRYGGEAKIGPQDVEVANEWRAGRLVLDSVTDLSTNTITFRLRRVENGADTTPQGGQDGSRTNGTGTPGSQG